MVHRPDRAAALAVSSSAAEGARSTCSGHAVSVDTISSSFRGLFGDDPVSSTRCRHAFVDRTSSCREVTGKQVLSVDFMHGSQPNVGVLGVCNALAVSQSKRMQRFIGAWEGM